MQALQYFGTDGIRGVYNQEPMTPRFMEQLAKATIQQLPPHGMVVLGRDTRASGVVLEAALVETFVRYGVQVMTLGVVPTAAVAYMTRSLGADLGIVLTASHNPASDNGVKFLSAQGQKLSIAAERAIEDCMQAPGNIRPASGSHLYYADAIIEYSSALRKFMGKQRLEGLKIVVDMANGAANSVVPNILRSLGAELICLGDGPNGQNINAGVGSEYPNRLSAQVKAVGADIGIAYDGDADRLVVCDASGMIVDGDRLLGMMALQFKSDQALKGPLVVTQQSNSGLDQSLQQHGIETIRADVGDRNVLYQMLASGSNLGGESSGHIILRDVWPTGDGILASLQVLKMLKQKTWGAFASSIVLFPQLTANVPVATKRPLADWRELQSVVQDAQETLSGRGRVMVRYSGTESKLRLLVEGQDVAALQQILESLKQVIG